jgi:anaerobic magnesium-protoporphyrin IX monomethyl ester cyclase
VVKFDKEFFFDELKRLNPNHSRFGRGFLGDKVYEYIICRGCPFDCSFCAAPLIKTWGEGKGWLGVPSSEKVVKKLKEDVEKYNLAGLAFHDDIFTFHSKWFLEFAKLYIKELKLPYVCNLIVGTFNGPVFDALVESNCRIVNVGIESGNEYIRTKIANRKIKTEKIISDLTRLKKAGIVVNTNNMIGFPEETFEQFMDTINVNAMVGLARSIASIYCPYPGTALYEKCRSGKLMEQNGNDTVMERKQSRLHLPNFPKKKIE